MRQLIVDEARKWIGVPFRHLGRDKRGVDCAGLLYVVYNAVMECELKNFIEYPPTPSTGFVFRSIREYADRTPPNKAQMGDVVLLNFAGASTHFGILTDLGVVHADTALKRVIEHSAPPSGHGRIVAYYKMRSSQWPK